MYLLRDAHQSCDTAGKTLYMSVSHVQTLGSRAESTLLDRTASDLCGLGRQTVQVGEMLLVEPEKRVKRCLAAKCRGHCRCMPIQPPGFVEAELGAIRHNQHLAPPPAMRKTLTSVLGLQNTHWMKRETTRCCHLTVELDSVPPLSTWSPYRLGELCRLMGACVAGTEPTTWPLRLPPTKRIKQQP